MILRSRKAPISTPGASLLPSSPDPARARSQLTQPPVRNHPVLPLRPFNRHTRQRTRLPPPRPLPRRRPHRRARSPLHRPTNRPRPHHDPAPRGAARPPRTGLLQHRGAAETRGREESRPEGFAWDYEGVVCAADGGDAEPD